MAKNPKLVNLKQTGRMIIAFLLLAVVVLAGCQGQSLLDAVFPEQDEAFGVSELTPKPEATQVQEMLPTPVIPEFYNLSVWLPQQFDPAVGTEAAVLINNQLTEFSENNPQIDLSVRIKPSTGPGSIIETITSASTAAPDSLPSLILISRSDLVQAASKNLLVPLAGLTEVMDSEDWFDVGRELGNYEGTFYCMPFAANTLALVYKHSGFTSDEPTWEDVIRQSEKIIFASGDPEALTSIALYQSAGGVLTGASGQPLLDSNALITILSAYDYAVKNNRISGSVLELHTDDQVWDEFLSSNKSSALTWTNHVLEEPNTYKLALLPNFGGQPFTLAGGWLWCMTEPHEQDKMHSVALAEYLVDPDFLALWAPLSGYLPVRPSTIPAFEGASILETISKILLSAHVRPDKIKITEIGTEINIAISEVIQLQYSPEASALNAIKRLEAMNN